MKAWILLLLSLTACYGSRLDDRQLYPQRWPKSQYPMTIHRRFLSEIELPEDYGTGLVLSHDAVHSGLAIMLLGTTGKLAQDLLDVMNVNSSLEDIVQSIDNLTYGISSDDFFVKKFNGLYIHPSKRPSEKFVNVLQLANAELIPAGYPENYVNNKIGSDFGLRDILKRSDFIPVGTRYEVPTYLVTAASFSAEWDNAGFLLLPPISKTVFHRKRNVDVRIETLFAPYQVQQYADLVDLRATMLTLSLKRTKVKFVVLLPTYLYGLRQLEEELEHVDLRSLLNRTRRREVEVRLPRIKLVSNLILDLKSLDVQGAFRYGVVGEDELNEREVAWRHITFLYLSANGINNNNASTGYGGYKSRDVDESGLVKFNADHPFFFAVLDDEKIYFTGRYGVPNN